MFLGDFSHGLRDWYQLNAGTWSQLDQLGLCAHYAEPGTPSEQPPQWQGPAAEFVRLEWEQNF
jgi:hypothetical protein